MADRTEPMVFQINGTWLPTRRDLIRKFDLIVLWSVFVLCEMWSWLSDWRHFGSLLSQDGKIKSFFDSSFLVTIIEYSVTFALTEIILKRILWGLNLESDLSQWRCSKEAKDHYCRVMCTRGMAIKSIILSHSSWRDCTILPGSACRNITNCCSQNCCHFWLCGTELRSFISSQISEVFNHFWLRFLAWRRCVKRLDNCMRNHCLKDYQPKLTWRPSL